MSTPEIEPTGNDQRTRKAGRVLVASGTTNIIFAIVILVCLTVIGKQADAIGAVSAGVEVMRAQFTDCKGKPATTQGCTEPAAAPPSVIVKQVVGSPGVPGLNGLPGAPGSAGVPGATGPGPSSAQVAAAVAAYCTGGRCAGKGPTAAQVAAAVSAYCSKRTDCTGPSGSRGEQGIEGKQGPPPTGDQVASAVAQYCGQETKPCRGDDGADSTVPGPVGPSGGPGRGISSVSCVDDEQGSHWEITYVDPGGVQTVAGPCRVTAGTTTPPSPSGLLR